MPAFLNDFQALLIQWYQLSLDNLAYVASIAVAVWLPFNLYYRFRLAMANRRHAAVTRQLSEIQARLEHKEREASSLRQEVSDHSASLEAEKLANSDLGQQYASLHRTWQQRNRQLSDLLHDLVHSLSLTDVAVLFRSGGDDESVWQASNHCIVKVGERLRAELQGRQEIERTVRGLQETLASRDTQIQRLENQLQQQLLISRTLQEKQERQEAVVTPVDSPQSQPMPHHEIASLLAQYQAGVLGENPVNPVPTSSPAASFEDLRPVERLAEAPVTPLVQPSQGPQEPPISVTSPSPSSQVNAEVRPMATAPEKKGGILGGMSLFGKKTVPSPQVSPITDGASSLPPQQAVQAATPSAAPVQAAPAPLVVPPEPPVQVSVAPAPVPVKKNSSGFMQKLSKVYNALTPEYVPVTKLGKETRSKMNPQD